MTPRTVHEYLVDKQTNKQTDTQTDTQLCYAIAERVIIKWLLKIKPSTNRIQRQNA